MGGSFIEIASECRDVLAKAYDDAAMERILMAGSGSHSEGVVLAEALPQVFSAVASVRRDTVPFEGSLLFWMVLRKLGVDAVHVIGRELAPPGRESVYKGWVTAGGEVVSTGEDVGLRYEVLLVIPEVLS